MVLQRYYNISYDQTEYQICDRLCFMRFLKLTIADDVPDSKTIWFFRVRFTDIGLVETLFELFIKKLTELNLIIHEGKIVDASFVEGPKQRNTRAENQTIKEGGVPQEWQNNPHKLAQKGVDAKWTKKNNIPYYGYKNHTKCDEKSKLITVYSVTSAAVHDSQPTEALLTPEDEQQPFFADSAYIGGALNKTLVEDKKVIRQIIEKGFKNKPLTNEQKENNKQKSKVRVRIEHIFGFMENSMNGSFIRSIGKVRAAAIIGLINLTICKRNNEFFEMPLFYITQS